MIDSPPYAQFTSLVLNFAILAEQYFSGCNVRDFNGKKGASNFAFMRSQFNFIFEKSEL